MGIKLASISGRVLPSVCQNPHHGSRGSEISTKISSISYDLSLFTTGRTNHNREFIRWLQCCSHANSWSMGWGFGSPLMGELPVGDIFRNSEGVHYTTLPMKYGSAPNLGSSDEFSTLLIPSLQCGNRTSQYLCPCPAALFKSNPTNSFRSLRRGYRFYSNRLRITFWFHA